MAVTAEPGQDAFRVEARCARCGRTLLPDDGVYVLRMTVDGAGSVPLRATLERVADRRRWSFVSGQEVARFVADLDHEHDGDGPGG